MKKLQRKISLKGGGFFKGHTDNEGKEMGEMSLHEANNPIQAKPQDLNDEIENFKVGGRGKGVQRSNTIAHHGSASPAHIPKRKHSQRVRTKSTIVQNCQICYGEFTQPKQLPCLHTFCQNCLEKFVNPKLMVECPTCREVMLSFVEETQIC